MGTFEGCNSQKKIYEAIKELLQEVSLSNHITIELKESAEQHEQEQDIRVTKLLEYLQDVLRSMKNLTEETQENIKSQKPMLDKKPCDPELVQISAENSEINRRIQAFMERKRGEVDRSNQREFCSAVLTTEDETSCARTDAVFVPRGGTKSHVKVSRVSWEYGPQTRPHLISAENPSILPSNKRSQTKKKYHGLDERLHNMESFLKLSAGQRSTDNSAVFQRLKVLEERILHLESVSPEYFTIPSSPFKRQRIGRSNQEDVDLQEIDEKIQKLQESLKKKKEAMSSSSG